MHLTKFRNITACSVCILCIVCDVTAPEVILVELPIISLHSISKYLIFLSTGAVLLRAIEDRITSSKCAIGGGYPEAKLGLKTIKHSYAKRFKTHRIKYHIIYQLPIKIYYIHSK